MLHRKSRLSLIDGGLLARIALCAMAVATFGVGLALAWPKESSARAENLGPVIPSGVRALGALSTDYQPRPLGPTPFKPKCPVVGKALVSAHAACICVVQGGEAVRANVGIECWRRLPPGSPFTHELMWELVAD